MTPPQGRCLISLKPLTGSESIPGYNATATKRLFGKGPIRLPLPFDRREFFQASRQASRGMSISGVQQKLSVSKDTSGRLAPVSTGGRFILKPSPEEYPFAAENEHTAMRMSALLGINTAECGLIAFKDSEELAYLTRRFDRLPEGGKLHQEDLLQCADKPSDFKYDFTYERAGRIVLEATDGKLAAVMDLVRRVILAYLMGNNDLHMKNLSLQRLPGNTTRYYDRLAPNYDVLFCQAFSDPPGATFLALGLLEDPSDGDEQFSPRFERLGFYSRDDFVELAHRLGLRTPPVDRFIDTLLQKLPQLLTLIEYSFMPAEMKERAKSLMTDRAGALRHR